MSIKRETEIDYVNLFQVRNIKIGTNSRRAETKVSGSCMHFNTLKLCDIQCCDKTKM